MATTKSGKGESTQGYFRSIFKENPKLLKQRSNDELFERWLKDHPGEKEVPQKVKQGLSNLKSVLRNRRKKRRKLKEETAGVGTGNGMTGAIRESGPKGTNALVRLESQIDDALLSARQIDSAGLEAVIGLLRSARNRVIVQLGAG